MSTFDLGEVIAEQTLVLGRGTESPRYVRVLLGQPLPSNQIEMQPWVCPYQISGAGREEVVSAFGATSINALAVALQEIALDLDAIELGAGASFRPGGQVDLLTPAGVQHPVTSARSAMLDDWEYCRRHDPKTLPGIDAQDEYLIDVANGVFEPYLRGAPLWFSNISVLMSVVHHISARQTGVPPETSSYFGRLVNLCIATICQHDRRPSTTAQ